METSIMGYIGVYRDCRAYVGVQDFWLRASGCAEVWPHPRNHYLYIPNPPSPDNTVLALRGGAIGIMLGLYWGGYIRVILG